MKVKGVVFGRVAMSNQQQAEVGVDLGIKAGRVRVVLGQGCYRQHGRSDGGTGKEHTWPLPLSPPSSALNRRAGDSPADCTSTAYRSLLACCLLPIAWRFTAASSGPPADSAP